MYSYRFPQIFPNSYRYLSCALVVVVLVTVVAVLSSVFDASYGHISSFFDSSETFDFIIVGGGPAGSIIAKRLSQLNPRHKIVLIEAGSEETQRDLWGGPDWTRFDIPAFWPTIETLTTYAWEFPSSANSTIYSFKGLGGCGMHNAMLYVRALPSDLSLNWNEDKSNIWSWDNALKSYMSLESAESTYNPDFHGETGAIHTWRKLNLNELDSIFMKSAVDCGFRQVVDFNDPNDGRKRTDDHIGVVGIYDFNIRNGIRDSAAVEMLTNAKSDKFSILPNTLVEKVLLDFSTDTQAVGVKVRNQLTGVSSNLHLRSPTSSVILTAGAIMTPHLLIQSGIGPSDEIMKFCSGDDCVVSPNVGLELQDHPFVPIVFQLNANASRLLERFTLNDLLWDWSNISSSSPLSDPGISVGAFMWSELALKQNHSFPDLQITLFKSISDPSVKRLLQNKCINIDSGILFTVALMTPTSRGRITSRNNMPFVNSSSNHLTTQESTRLADGVSIVREIVANMNVADAELYPGLTFVEEDLVSWVKESSLPNFHWCGSARMGSSVQNSVVDSRLRVHGVKGLRIADASIIPVIPNGNVHSTICMASFRGAELVSQDLE